MSYTEALSADAPCNLLCRGEQADLTSLQECAHKVLIAGLFMEGMQTPFECVAESSFL